MLIGVVSDSHGNTANVARALQGLEARAVRCILHCGDIDDAATVALFTGTPTHFVQGNCDQDPHGLAAACAVFGLTFHGSFADLKLAGKRLAVLHGDDKKQLREVLDSGEYDYVFTGHTHVAEDRQAGRTRLVNPGALHRARPKTVAVVDLAADRVEFLTVAD